MARAAKATEKRLTVATFTEEGRRTSQSRISPHIGDRVIRVQDRLQAVGPIYSSHGNLKSKQLLNDPLESRRLLTPTAEPVTK
jgi:hypothetical protein